MSTKCYIEQRKASARGTDSLLADVMRHLHTRLHLGKTIIVCDQPMVSLGAARKQWLKLSRVLQRQRSSTVNADKILKYTHAITRMQHMHFTTKGPTEQPEADVYFLEPKNLTNMPVQCWSIYILTELKDQTVVQTMLKQLSSDALFIDYTSSSIWHRLGLSPKKDIEKQVSLEWKKVKKILQSYNVNVEVLVVNDIHNIEAIDDALDTLLGMSHKFLQIAGDFQRVLELARPLRIDKKTRESYDSLVLLAHRVQALNPGKFTKQFLETYNEDDTFFLYDHSHQRKQILGTESLVEATTRHKEAGRTNLARSLHALAEATT